MTLSICTQRGAATPDYSTAGDWIPSSEVAEALVGFLDPVDSSLFPLEDLFDTARFDKDLSDTASFDDISDTAAFDNDLFSSPSLPDPHRCAKRQRCCSDFYFSPPPQPPMTLFQSPVAVAPAPPLPPPPRRPENGVIAGRSSSPQSIAAKERRKKISEKTQQLGHLIPGSNKINSTAEKLLAAHKYVKYLQAQIGILDLMTSQRVTSGDAGEELLQVMMASAVVQERLSREGVCLVPKELVDEFAADPQLLKFRPLIERERYKFTGTASETTEKIEKKCF